ncbi:MAG: 5'-methylthioadenosine/S-adenosylhomocysteine nucleosidase [Blastocatellales bacterium]
MIHTRYQVLAVRTALLFCLLVSLSWLTFAQPAPASRLEAPLIGEADILVQGALDWELQPLISALEKKEEIQIASWTFWRGYIGGKRVVVSRTEVGTINAVAATTLAVLHFRPGLIINQGTAGASDPELKVFDIVIGESTVDYSSYRSAPAREGEGVLQSRRTPIPHRIRIDGRENLTFQNFPGDPKAIEHALSTEYKRGRLIRGIIGSAFEYNREIDRLNWVRKTFGAVSEDMESAFTAGVAVGFKIPFVAIRIISDSEFYAPELQRSAGEYCAAFVVDVIRTMK